MTYTQEQIKAMGKRELLEVAEAFNIEMDTSTPKAERTNRLLEFFATYKGPESDVEWEDPVQETEKESTIDVKSTETQPDLRDSEEKSEETSTNTEEPTPELHNSEEKDESVDENVVNAEETVTTQEESDVEEKTDTGESQETETKSETVEQPKVEEKEEPGTESHEVEEFVLEMARLGRIPQYQPGVAFIKRDGSGKNRGVVPVHKAVYDALVEVHDGVVCQYEMLDLSKFDNVEKLSIARVIKNIIDHGHVYIRSNHSSAIFFL